MNIIIKTKNIKIVGSLRYLVIKKIGKLEKFLRRFKQGQDVGFDVFVEVERETLHHRKGDVFKAEAIIKFLGRDLKARAHGDNLVKTIIDVQKELEREIGKYKTQVIEMPRRKQKKLKNVKN